MSLWLGSTDEQGRGDGMEFGVVFQTDPPASRVIDLARRAEEHGFTHVWVFDSPLQPESGENHPERERLVR